MAKTNSNQNLPSNPNNKARKGKKRKIVGYRLVPMTADAVDDVARAEGRGDNTNVRDKRLRCRLCFLKGATTPTPGKRSSDHFCRWNIVNSAMPAPDKPIRQVPVYGWVDD
jgi:hypothetical protein